MFKRGRTLAMAAGLVLVATATASAAMADTDSGRNTAIHGELSGYQEDPQVVSTTGNGRFRAHVDDNAQEVTFELSYDGLQGNVTQAHIHFGGKAQSGGIIVFLCTNLGNGPAGTQPCPAAPATVTGTLRPGDIIGPAGQGITAGQFDEFVAAVRAGVTYANVHSSMWPGGEVRAQLNHHH